MYTLSNFVYLKDVNGKHRLFIGPKASISLICIVCEIALCRKKITENMLVMKDIKLSTNKMSKVYKFQLFKGWV